MPGAPALSTPATQATTDEDEGFLLQELFMACLHIHRHRGMITLPHFFRTYTGEINCGQVHHVDFVTWFAVAAMLFGCLHRGGDIGNLIYI